MNTLNIIAVAIGGALGAVGRYALYDMLTPSLRTGWFFMPTLLVNVLGSALIGGVYAYLLIKLSITPWWRHLIMIGFLGAFTTFSTFSLDVLRQLQAGQVWQAVSYILASVVMCLIAVSVGYWMVEKLIH